MKKTLLIFFAVCCFSNIYAQRQAANWYFGYGAGVKFNLANNTLTAVNNGMLFTNEGCSSISDDLGNLLFYTDGSTVWNKNHVAMQNGFGLFGDNSSTQSAIIVPKPNDPNIYYIFTVDTTIGTDPDNGFNYSTVDISLNGGLGAVTQKNVNLLNHCSEKLTAVLKDCITKSIWVITLASEDGSPNSYNTFHAFEVSNAGVNTTSVKSTFPIAINDRRGYLKLSPDGTKMAVANTADGLQILDFDAFTGKASNLSYLTINSTESPFPYGIEFSPNSNLLYVHAYNNFFDFDNQARNEDPANHTSVLAQFNLAAPNVQASQVILDDRNLYRGGLQLGPNGKIYRALSATYTKGLSYLGVINNPNVVGAGSLYQHNAVNLGANQSSQGLPPFIASFFNKQIDIIKNGESATNLNLCDGDTYTLTSTEIPGATYTWTVDDTPLPETDFDLEVSKSGFYKVYIDPNNGDCAIEGDAFVLINPNPSAFNHSLLQCDEDGVTDGITRFNLNQAIPNITGGSTTVTTKFFTDAARTNEIDGADFTNTSNPQTIFVEVIEDKTQCFSVSELTLSVSITDANNTTLTVCDDDGFEDGFYNFNLKNAETAIINGLPTGLNISYYETYNNALLEINALNNSFTNTIAYNQTIYARTENDNNCYGISQIQLVVNVLPNIETEYTTHYCLNTYPKKITINAGILVGNTSNYTYQWSTGENSYSIDINQPGDYEVIVTNANMCSKTRVVKVLPSNIATIDAINIKDASVNNTITVIVSGEGSYEYRLLDENNVVYAPYQSSNIFENVKPGIYTISVIDTKNNCGATPPQKVSVIGFPKFFTPNNDGKNDTWQIYGVNDMFQPNTKIQIFDRYGKLVKQLNPLSNGWDGYFNGNKLPADDYWFSITLQDGRIFKNHFTLKY
ncbi:T9SS type B sorting domain-containing protein [Seonamhaeicola algicola]|uniref:T9SS type B sorting domain-containing protein n=1 Tax=Seonamhaeicola algicola TaxID=1719036 RepID=A0A5C7AMN3_9FLAO|nr:T9SS type B sorting domain-containing protein [Seonamhaeicola algicola]TXE07082.1 T9SS type B sorting domain-containing protein [Seonamhaeicola algicola]